MPAQIRIILTGEEERTLRELRQAQTVPTTGQRTRSYLTIECPRTQYRQRLRAFLNVIHIQSEQPSQDGNTEELGDCGKLRGRGAKSKWTGADLEYIEKCLELEPRTYNSPQLVLKLKQERQVDLSSSRLREILKKKGIAGNEPELAIDESRISGAKPSSKPI